MGQGNHILVKMLGHYLISASGKINNSRSFGRWKLDILIPFCLCPHGRRGVIEQPGEGKARGLSFSSRPFRVFGK